MQRGVISIDSEMINLFTTFITSVGFPIVCCYFLYKYIEKKDTQISDIMDQHEEEVSAMTKAINGMTNSLDANTKILERMVDQLEN